MIKKPIIFLLAFSIAFLGGCSGNPAFGLNYYDMIQLDGDNYCRLTAFSEAQPVNPTQVGDFVQVYLVGYNGKVDRKKAYEAQTYTSDPEHLFLFFDGCYWGKEGHFDGWTVPHKY